MRVACIGNMNNNFFALTRFLRDMGVDAELLLLDTEQDHFHPSADSYDRRYQAFTRSVGWGNYARFLKVTPAEIEASVDGYDVLIGCGTVPGFLDRIGRRLDVAVPYGDDIWDLPNFRLVDPRWQRARFHFSRAQRRGLREARYLHMGITNPAGEAMIDRIGRTGGRLTFAIPMVYTTLFNPDTIQDHFGSSQWYGEFRRIREENDFVLFHHARHNWRPERGSWEYKGTDKLLRGFAEMVRARPGIRATMVSCEYGKDVELSRALAHELGIGNRIQWFPRMPRKDIMVGMALADMGTGEFGLSYFSCGTIYETLAMAKPLLHHRDDSLYAEEYPEMYPMVHANTIEEIAGALIESVDDPGRVREIGEGGRAWLQKHMVDIPLREYGSILGIDRAGVPGRAAVA
jgi:glycosyltransferase involved in cell wall biosynthesis